MTGVSRQLMFHSVSRRLLNLDHKRILEQKLVLKQWFLERLRYVTSTRLSEKP
jgi:hypothetical protein